MTSTALQTQILKDQSAGREKEGLTRSDLDFAIDNCQEEIKRTKTDDFINMAENYLKLALLLFNNKSQPKAIQDALKLCLRALCKIRNRTIITEKLLQLSIQAAKILAFANESCVSLIFDRIIEMIELYGFDGNGEESIKKRKLTAANTEIQNIGSLPLQSILRLQLALLSYFILKKDNVFIIKTIQKVMPTMEQASTELLSFCRVEILTEAKTLVDYLETYYNRTVDRSFLIEELLLESHNFFEKIMGLLFGIKEMLPKNIAITKDEIDIVLKLSEHKTMIAFEYGRTVAKTFPSGEHDKSELNMVPCLEGLITYPYKPDYYIERDKLEPKLVAFRDALRQLFCLASINKTEKPFPLRIYQAANWAIYLLSKNVGSSISQELLSYNFKNISTENLLMLKLSLVKAYCCERYWHREKSELNALKIKTFEAMPEVFNLLKTFSFNKDSPTQQFIAKQLFELAYLFFHQQDNREEFLNLSLQLQEFILKNIKIDNDPFFLARQNYLWLCTQQILRKKDIDFPDIQNLILELNAIIKKVTEAMPSNETISELVQSLDLLLAIITDINKITLLQDKAGMDKVPNLYPTIMHLTKTFKAHLAKTFQEFYGEKEAKHLLRLAFLQLRYYEIPLDEIHLLTELIEAPYSKIRDNEDLHDYYDSDEFKALLEKKNVHILCYKIAEILVRKKQFKEAHRFYKIYEGYLSELYRYTRLTPELDSESKIKISLSQIRLSIAANLLDLTPPEMDNSFKMAEMDNSFKMINMARRIPGIPTAQHNALENMINKVLNKITEKFFSTKDSLESNHFELKLLYFKFFVWDEGNVLKVVKEINEKVSNLKLEAESEKSRALSQKVFRSLIGIFEYAYTFMLSNINHANMQELFNSFIQNIKALIYPSDILSQLELQFVYGQFLLKSGRYRETNALIEKIVSQFTQISREKLAFLLNHSTVRAEICLTQMLVFAEAINWESNALEEDEATAEPPVAAPEAPHGNNDDAAADDYEEGEEPAAEPVAAGEPHGDGEELSGDDDSEDDVPDDDENIGNPGDKTPPLKRLEIRNPKCLEIRIALKNLALKLTHNPQIIFTIKLFQLSDFLSDVVSDHVQINVQIEEILRYFLTSILEKNSPSLDFSKIPAEHIMTRFCAILSHSNAFLWDYSKRLLNPTNKLLMLRILHEKLILDERNQNLEIPDILNDKIRKLMESTGQLVLFATLDSVYSEKENAFQVLARLMIEREAGLLPYLFAVIANFALETSASNLSSSLTVNKKIIHAILSHDDRRDSNGLFYDISARCCKLFLLDNPDYLLDEQKINADAVKVLNVTFGEKHTLMNVAKELRTEMEILLDNLEPLFTKQEKALDLKLLFWVASTIMQYCDKAYISVPPESTQAISSEGTSVVNPISTPRGVAIVSPERMSKAFEVVYKSISENFSSEVPVADPLVKIKPRDIKNRTFLGSFLCFQGHGIDIPQTMVVVAPSSSSSSTAATPPVASTIPYSPPPPATPTNTHRMKRKD